MMTKGESFTETSYYYSAAPGSRGERLVCMPESQGRASIGIALQNAAKKLQTTGPTTTCNTSAQQPQPQIQTIVSPSEPTTPQCPPNSYWDGMACRGIEAPISPASNCPAGSYWNGSVCVGMTDVPLCSAGYQWDGVVCRQVVPSAPKPVLCPDGHQWNGMGCVKTSPGCKTPGMIWDAKIGACRYPSTGQIPAGANCPKGYKYDGSSGMCLKTSPNCPVGQIWDGKRCRLPNNPRPPVRPGTGNGIRQRVPTCPKGYKYDPSTSMCRKTSPNCPVGQIWDGQKCRLPNNPRPPVSYTHLRAHET